MVIIFIEDKIEDELIKWLSFIYQKTDTHSIMFICYMRTCIYFNKDKISTEELCEFILYELNLPNDFYYENIKVSTKSYYEDNSLLNVIDNLKFRFLETPYNDVRRGLIYGKEFILELFRKNIRSARNKIRGIKYTDKKQILNYFMLTQLYNEFNLNMQLPKQFDNVSYPDNFNFFNLTMDEIAIRHYETYKQQKEKLVEKELEDYIYKNGLFDIKIFKRQMKIKNGIIDLMGIDDNNIKVMIELKIVSKPRDLLWQISLYQNNLKDEFKNESFRTMVIAPPLDDSIIKLLPVDCEIIEFKKYKSKYNFKKVR